MATTGSHPVDDEGGGGRKRRGGLWAALAALIALLIVGGAFLLAGTDDDPRGRSADAQPSTETAMQPATAPAGTAGTAGATTAPPASTTPPAETTAPAGGTTTGALADPVVQRLARGRELPFTVGPWRRASYRETVYSRLREETLPHAKKVRYRGGFGIRFS
jgi:hypothetical protein